MPFLTNGRRQRYISSTIMIPIPKVLITQRLQSSATSRPALSKRNGSNLVPWESVLCGALSAHHRSTPLDVVTADDQDGWLGAKGSTTMVA